MRGISFVVAEFKASHEEAKAAPDFRARVNA